LVALIMPVIILMQIIYRIFIWGTTGVNRKSRGWLNILNEQEQDARLNDLKVFKLILSYKKEECLKLNR